MTFLSECHRPTCWRGIFILILLALCGFFPQKVEAQKKPTKQELESAFLYNFAKFVDWPTNASSDPIIIGVLGKKDPFGKALEDTVGSQKVNGCSFKIQRFENLEDVDVCHILFISTEEKMEAAEKVRLKDIFAKIQDRPILTVGESGRGDEGFAGCGGIVNFYTVEDKVRFEINLDAAKRSNLKISSKLLNLAQIVHDATAQQ